MRLKCPFCGERTIHEFAYQGDADVVRPATPPGTAMPEGAEFAAWMDYVYLRRNSADRHNEYWYHAAGCRSVLVVTRNVTTHAIEAIRPAASLGADASSGSLS
jgi:heterotetrameric sarcosine oxidase delta subunit